VVFVGLKLPIKLGKFGAITTFGNLAFAGFWAGFVNFYLRTLEKRVGAPSPRASRFFQALQGARITELCNDVV
jgi:hypothetical protein